MSVQLSAQFGASLSGSQQEESTPLNSAQPVEPPETVMRDLRAFLSVAETTDGMPPVSDQAVIGAARGERVLLLFEDTDATVADAQGPDQPLAAVGIVGGGELDLVVKPDLRRQGIGTRVLQHLLQVQAAHLGKPTAEENSSTPHSDGDGESDGAIRSWAHGENPAATALLTRAGFTPVRELLRMTLSPELLPQPTDDPVVPVNYRENYQISAFSPGSSEQAQEWVRVNAAAFASHPEQGKLTLEDFVALTNEDWFQAEDLFLCFDECFDEASGPQNASGQVVGYAWIKTVHIEAATHTELYAIGVHPDAAGNGLGGALLTTVLKRMAQHRPTQVSLYVDGDNEAAVNLYLRSGFTVEQRSMQWLLK